MRGYAICGERRSGSLFLCNILTSTGVLGNPSEFFAPMQSGVKSPTTPTIQRASFK